MPYIKDREAYYAEQGITSTEPAAPKRPAPLTVEDQNWLNLYRNNLDSLAQVAPEAHGRIVATIRANEQAAQPAIERWNQKFSHLSGDLREACLQKIAAAVQKDPQRYHHSDGSLNIAETEKLSIQLTQSEAERLGESGKLLDDEILDDFIQSREKALTARRGYGFARDSMFNSMNLPTQH